MLVENNESPEFPLPAYRDLTQVLSLPLDEGQSAEDIVATTVRVAPLSVAAKASSMVTFKSEVNYGWEDRFYHGQLVNIHKNGSLLAYAMTDRQTKTGTVRIVKLEDGSRLLIKGIKGPICDVTFSHSENPVVLAVVDEFYNLYVYEIEISPRFRSKPLLTITHNEISPVKDLNFKVVWQPVCDIYADDVDPLIFALLLGSVVEVWRVGEVASMYGAAEVDVSKVVTAGLTVIKQHTDTVTSAVFSMEGSALATVSLDGTFVFFQLYMDEKPKILYNWKPHNDSGVTFLAFLDNVMTPGEKIWNFVITAANENREIKLWNCTDWSLIQSITLEISGRLKLALDSTAKILLASDQSSQVLYLFKVHTGASAHLDAVSAYYLPLSILSLCIISLTGRIAGEAMEDDTSDLSDEEYGEANVDDGVMCLYVINPQSLHHCTLQYLLTKTGCQLPLSTLAPEVPNLPPPFTLMTPKELTSPAAKPPPADPVAVKDEPVEVAISGASSPSQEVSEILSHSHNDIAELTIYDTPNVQVPEVTIKKELEEVPAVSDMNWSRISIPDTTPKSKRESLGKTPTTVQEFTGSPMMEPPRENTNVNDKLDAIIAMIQNQQAQITDISKRLNKQEGASLGEQLKECLDGHSRRMLAAMEAQTVRQQQQQARHDSTEMASRERLHQLVSQLVEKQLSSKLGQIIPQEIRNSVLPGIINEMEPFKRNLHNEMTQQLSATDHLLKENISKLAHNKSVMDVLANSVTMSLRNTMGEACKEIMVTHLLPKLDKGLEKSFQQVHETFSKGISEWSNIMREESERTVDEIKRAGRALEQLTESNKVTTRTINDHIEKTLNTMSDRLNKQVAEVLQMVSLTVRPGSAARVKSPPELLHDRQAAITQYLRAGQYNNAFKEALSASDLNVVMFTCEKLPAARLFESSCQLAQPVLLSLIQQLSADLTQNTKLKCSYLSDAVLHLEPNDPSTKEHLLTVIAKVDRHITNFITNNQSSPHCAELYRTLKDKISLNS